MRKISFWAKSHILLARIIIILSYLLLSFIGVVIGSTLSSLNIVIPLYSLYITLSIAVLSFCLYPTKNKVNYSKRKLFDFALVMTTFVMIIVSINRENMNLMSEKLFASSVIFKDSANDLSENIHMISFFNLLHHKNFTILSSREKKHILKNQIRQINKDKIRSKGEKNLLIALSIIVALALMIGIVGLACNLACAGSGTAATILWIGGWFFILFFLARTINYIVKGPRQRARQKRQDALRNVGNKGSID